jgi:hypothetical protein
LLQTGTMPHAVASSTSPGATILGFQIFLEKSPKSARIRDEGNETTARMARMHRPASL